MKESTVSRISYVLFMAWNLGVLVFLVALGVVLLPKDESLTAIQWYLMTANAILAIIAASISVIAITAMRAKWIKEGIFSDVVATESKSGMQLVKPTMGGHSITASTASTHTEHKVARRNSRTPR